MREILFRGKRTGGGEWIEGYLIRSLHANTESAYIGYLFGEHDCDVAEVDPKTVGQYTGLKDKNGEKIFEGDLVISTSNRRLTNKPVLVKDNPTSGYWMCRVSREPLIIGNIHDNPELLEV